MHVSTPILRTFQDESVARTVLGDREPLVDALARYATALVQLSVTVAAVATCAAWFALGDPSATPQLIGAGVATLGFGLRAILRASDVHEWSLQLLVAGRGGVPIPAVQRELRALCTPAHVAALARSYEEVGLPPGASGRVAHRACVIAVPRVMSEVRPELTDVARLLRADDPPAEGVAAAEWLLCSSGTRLFGDDAELLRQDLRRIAFLLDSQRG